MAATAQDTKVQELLKLLQDHFGVQPGAARVVVTLGVDEPVVIEQTYFPRPQ